MMVMNELWLLGIMLSIYTIFCESVSQCDMEYADLVERVSLRS
jgi:hypothetical protein